MISLSLRGDRRSYVIALAALFALAVSLFLVLRAQPVHAANCTFASVGDNNFNTAANWTCGMVPDASSTANIPAATSTFLTANTTVTAVSSTGNVYLTGFNLTVATGTISGNGAINASGTGMFVATSTVSVLGTLSSTSSLINIQGLLTVQSGGVVTSTSATMQFQSVTSSGSIGSSSGAINVTSTTSNSGTFEVGSGTTTLIGNATNTALGTIKNELGTLAVQADFENVGAGTYTGGRGTFSVTGGGAQRIGGSSVATSFYNFTLAKSAGTATLFNNVTSTNNVTLTSGTLNLNDKTLFVGGNWSNGGGTLTGPSASSIVTFNGTGAQTIGAETGFQAVRINKSAGTATAGGNITTLAITLQNGTFDLSSTTLTISGNGGTNPFQFTSGVLAPGTSTVVYNTSAGATTQIASTNYYNLTISGTSQTYNMAASTTAVGVFTVGTGATVTIAAAVNFTTGGTMVNTGTITEGAAASIIHTAEAYNFANESGTTVSSVSTPVTLYVQIQDSNRNLNGTSADTMSITVNGSAAAGGDAELVTLTETGASTGIFRSAGLSVIPSNVTSSNNGLLEIKATGSGNATYVDNQDSTDSHALSVTITYSSTGGASTVTTSGGGGGGGSPIPAVTTSYQSYTAGGTTGGTTVQNPGIVPAHTLVKLPDDGNPKTQMDSAVYYVGADGRRHAFPNSKTYFTWYKDFSGVQVISADQLAQYTLGANVTYKPGERMVKFTTDPKVYAVGKGGLLRWIKTEAVATELYGASWNKTIDDINDAFHANYDFGPDVTGKSDFDPASVETSVTYPSDSLK